MLGKDLDKSEVMVNAILIDEALSEPAKQLIKSIFQKQQEILIALQNIVSQEGYRNQHIEKRLDELLEKVDPEKAAKRKECISESSAGIRIPSVHLF